MGKRRSIGFINYLATTIFVALLIWGPIDHSRPAWFLIRIGYLIFIPLLVKAALNWVWKHWLPNKKAENALERVLSAIICLILFTIAIIMTTSKTHIGNTLWIRTREGMEAVGDDIILPGPDYGTIFFLILIALLFLWFGVFKKGSKSSDI